MTSNALNNYSKIKKANVLVNKDAYLRETLSKWPVRLPLKLPYTIICLNKDKEKQQQQQWRARCGYQQGRRQSSMTKHLCSPGCETTPWGGSRGWAELSNFWGWQYVSKLLTMVFTLLLPYHPIISSLYLWPPTCPNFHVKIRWSQLFHVPHDSPFPHDIMMRLTHYCTRKLKSTILCNGSTLGRP